MKQIILIIALYRILSATAQEPLYFNGTLDLEDTSQFKYILIDTVNFWFIGNPEKDSLSLPSVHGKNLLYTDTSIFHRSNVKSSIQFRLIRYGGSVHCIRFYQKYDFEKNVDGSLLETSHDNGQTWQNIIFDPVITENLREEYYTFYKSTDTISSFGGQPGFTGKFLSGGYSEICWFDEGFFDTMLVRFTFASDSVDSGNEGWLLDDFNFGIIIEDYIKLHADIPVIQAFPNPALNRIAIQGNAAPINKIEDFSPAGKLISSHFYDQELDISFLTPGVYFLRCYTALNDSFTIKFCKR